jgi:hypothetical protein
VTRSLITEVLSLNGRVASGMLDHHGAKGETEAEAC